MEIFGKKGTSSSEFDLPNNNHSNYLTIKDFMAESRKCQTLFANCEGFYSRRVVSLNDENTLKNFVYSTMYFDGVNSWDNEQNYSKHEHVEEMANKIVTTSKGFDLGQEIHFGVVWVYYFSYEDKTLHATPVFKIYKRKSEEEAVFLDVTLTLHENWDHYLDSAKLPVSLLCVPRKGEYSFLRGGGDERTESKLDLEFFRSKQLILPTPTKWDRFGALITKPFSQVAIRPWLIRIKRFTVEQMEQIKKFICILWGKKVNISSFLNASLFAFLMWIRIKENGTISNILETLSVDSLMLLRTPLGERSRNSFLTPGFFSEIVKVFEGFSSIGSDVMQIRETLTEVQRKALLLIKLLRNHKQNWIKILELFCILFSESKPILFTLSRFVFLPLPLRILLCLLDASCKVFEAFQMNFIKGSQSKENRKSRSSTSLMSANTISSIQLNESQTEIFPRSKCSVETFDTHETLEAFNNLAFENVLLDLSSSEMTSADETQKRFYDEFVREQKAKGKTAVPSSQSTLFLGEFDGYGIFFIQKASLPQLTFSVSQLIGKEFILKPQKTTVHDVILKSEKRVGTLFFPLEYSAVGCFSLEEMGEESRKGFSEVMCLTSKAIL